MLGFSAARTLRRRPRPYAAPLPSLEWHNPLSRAPSPIPSPVLLPPPHMPQPAPEPPMADPRRQSPPPPMVLVDRCVVLEIIEEAAGGRLACSSSGGGGEKIVDVERYFAEVLGPAFQIRCNRKASRPNVVRKEPLPEFLDVYIELLDGIEFCFSQLADPPSVARFSLKLSCPPRHLLAGHPSSAFLSSCHHYFLVFYVGGYRPCIRAPGFYLVYNAWANSVAIVPRIHCINNMSRINEETHSDIGSGVAVLCCGKQGDYILVELLLRRDCQSGLRTNTANLFVWGQSGRWEWVQREVVLPLPDAEPVRWVWMDKGLPIPAADQTAAADEQQRLRCSFHADMVFAVSFSSLCWVDLLTGILVYNHIDSREFHFIPLPEECAMDTGMRYEPPYPDEFRSMCCIDRQTLKFVSVDGFKQFCPIEELMITTWTLRRPLSPRNWKWEKDVVPSFRIQDLWDDPVYKLKLQPLMPACPVISTREPGIIYLSVKDYKYNIHYELESEELYMLSLNMDRRRVESVYKVPSNDNGTCPYDGILTSDFSSYLNKTREWDLIRCRRDDLYEGPRGKELADEGESSIGGILSNTLRPPVPSSCDPQWTELVEQCWSQEPEKRPKPQWRELMEQCWSQEPEKRPTFTEVESRSNASSPYTVGAGLGMLNSSRCGLGGGRAIITTPRTAPGPSSRKTGPWASSFCRGNPLL